MRPSVIGISGGQKSIHFLVDLHLVQKVGGSTEQSTSGGSVPAMYNTKT